MTAGHTHRIVKVRRGGLAHRLLTRRTLWVSGNLERVDRSRFVYGPTDDPDRWRLSPLGLLHGLTGLTLQPVDGSLLARLLDRIVERWADAWDVEWPGDD
jgi:hypothetical protein